MLNLFQYPTEHSQNARYLAGEVLKQVQHDI